MHRITTLIITFSVLLAGIGVASVPAAAQSDDASILDEVVGTSEGIASDIRDGASFTYAYYKTKALNAFADDDGDPEWSATDTRDALHNPIDGNNSAYQSWLNARLDAASDRDTLQIRLDNGTSTATLFLVADVENGSYQGFNARETTDRTVDESCTLAGDAGANAPAELDTFYTEYVEPGENVSTSFTGRLAAEYKDDIDCTFIGS